VKTLFWSSLLGLSVLAGLASALARSEDDFAPSSNQAKTTVEVVQRLNAEHYRRLTIDDGFSSELFDRYLDFLDPARTLFLASDVKELERYRFELDDDLQKGKLADPFAIFNRMQARRLSQIAYQEAALAEDLEAIDFDVDEVIEIDRSEAARPATLEEQQDLFRKRFKNDVLGLRLTDRTPDEIRDILGRRYADQRRRVEQTKADDVFSSFMNAFAQSYDPHTNYLPPMDAAAFDIEMSLKLEGIGALLGVDGEYIKIERLIPAGPAEKGGELRPTDRIVSVAQGDEEMESIVGWRPDEAAKLIRGERGSVVRLLVLPAGQSDEAMARVISITRDEVKLEEQAAHGKVLEVSDGDTTRRVGVIELPAFYLDFEAIRNRERDIKSSTRDVAVILQGFVNDGIESVVLDLRNNGGGSLLEAQRLTGLFLGDVPVVQVQEAGGRAQVLTAGTPPMYDGSLVVLVNRFSASASEILAGAIQDYGRGVVVGARTWGKGTVQVLMPIADGELKLTQAKCYRVSGGSTQNKGVVPDIAFPSGFYVEELGESSLEGALPWDSIRAAKGFSPREDLTDEIAFLDERHAQRSAGDIEFEYLASMEEYMHQRSLLTSVPLKESARKAEQLAAEKELLAIENARRLGLGEAPFETYEEASAASVDREDEVDPVQLEAARIAVELRELETAPVR